MKNLAIFAFVITSVLNSQNTTKDKNTASEKSNELLKDLVVKHKSIAAVAGISQGDSILWKSAYGYMDKKKSKKANTQMLTRIASIAKPMTAIAVMQLCENGLIELDDPINKYINEFPSLNNTQITIRQLLNHSSGIKAYASKKEFKTAKNYGTLTDAMNVFKNRKTIDEPGRAYHYTTYGYVVLGVLIERVSGLSYENYMKNNIWGKAGMENTGVECYGKSYDNKSQLYDKSKNNKIKHIKEVNNLSNRIPGGGFHSTLDDLLKFGQAILNNTLVKPETLELMFNDNGLKKDGNPYGLGWFMYGAKPNPEKVFGHSGAQTGASTQLLIIPSEQKVVVVLSNTSGVWDETIGTAAGLFSIYKKNED